MKLFDKLLIILLCLTPKEVLSSQKSVLNYIFEGYDQRIRPVKNESLPLIVQVSPFIIRLIEVNTQQEYIKLCLALNQAWKDEFLTWDPAEFNGTEFVHVSITAVWIPDTTVITTSFELEEIVETDRKMVTVWSDGSVYLSYPFVLSNYCPMKTDEFPYDQQDCIIKVTSWLYDKTQIRMEPLQNETGYPQNNNTEWNMLPITFKTYEFIDTTGIQYRQLWYTFSIQRKPAYYFWVLIMPTLIITALSLAGIFAPLNNIGERQEKMTLGLTTLLTQAVILSLVAGEMPRATNLPLLGYFVLVEIVIIVLSLAISVLVLFLHQRATTRPWPVPSLLYKLLACDCGRKKQKVETVIVLPPHPVKFPPPPSPDTIYNIEKSNDFQYKVGKAEWKESINYMSDSTTSTPLDDMIAKVKDFIDKNEEEKKELADEEKRKEQWMYLFDHLDLLLFVSFQVIHVVIYLAFFYRN